MTRRLARVAAAVLLLAVMYLFLTGRFDQPAGHVPHL